MTVGDHQIDVAVAVGVEKCGPEPQLVATGYAETGEGCVFPVVGPRPMVEPERELADITSCELA